MAEAHKKQRFLDTEEAIAVKTLMDGLHPTHPVRTAFDQGADFLHLVFMATNMEIRHRLRDLRVAALNRWIAAGAPTMRD